MSTPGELRPADRSAATRRDFRRYARPARSSRLAANREEGALGLTKSLLVAVDVGTGSARAGVLTPQGALLGRAEHPIAMNRTDANHAEHDSEQIWSAVCSAVRDGHGACRRRAPRSRRPRLRCHLFAGRARPQGRPVTVSTNGEDRWDTIVWLDHRALDRSRRMHRTGHARAQLCRRRHVAGNGSAQADVAQAPSAANLGTRRP